MSKALEISMARHTIAKTPTDWSDHIQDAKANLI